MSLEDNPFRSQAIRGLCQRWPDIEERTKVAEAAWDQGHEAGYADGLAQGAQQQGPSPTEGNNPPERK